MPTDSSIQDIVKKSQNILNGILTKDEIRSILLNINKIHKDIDGINLEILNSFVNTALKNAKLVQNISNKYPIVDICGTGGDGLNTLNISTACSIVLSASEKLSVAKHGNKSVSSKSGSFDVISKLNLPICETEEDVKNNLRDYNIGFIFAPFFHSSFKNIAEIRKEIKEKTIFNLLGPIINPVELDSQIVGIYNKDIQTYAKALINRGVKAGIVANAENGMDEISNVCKTNIVYFTGGNITKTEIISPEDFGMKLRNISDITGGEPDYNHQKMIEMFKGGCEAYKEIVALNCGYMFYITNVCNSVKNGIDFALDIINSGKALAKIEALSKK